MVWCALKKVLKVVQYRTTGSWLVFFSIFKTVKRQLHVNFDETYYNFVSLKGIKRLPTMSIDECYDN